MLNRRDFLKSSTILAALALKPGSMPGESKPQKANTIGRLVLPMNRNWRFSPQHIADATARDFDDSGFEQVNIPHSNKRLPWHSFDEKSYEFVSVYRRRFRLPPGAYELHV